MLYRFQNTLDDKNITVEATSNINNAVWVDVTSLETIITQLIDNALKYAQSTQINIHCSIINHLLTITVRDFGSGIPAPLQSMIFEPGFQENGSENSGYGLGLSSSRYLARLNNGDVKCMAADPGLKFVVTLAVKEVA